MWSGTTNKLFFVVFDLIITYPKNLCLVIVGLVVPQVNCKWLFHLDRKGCPCIVWVRAALL